MEAKQIDRCVRRLKCQWPLVGGWLRRKAARKLAEENSPKTIGVLARAWVETKDRRVIETARQAVEQVSTPASVAAVCEVWAQTRHVELASVLAARQWIVTTPPQLRVLTALLCDRADRLCAGNGDIVAPLVDAAADADSEIARRAREALPKLKKQEAIDEFCRLWSESRAPLLDEVLQQGGYVPRQPPAALRADRGAQLQADGPEVVEPLALACRGTNPDIVAPLVAAAADADPEIARRARETLPKLKKPEAVEEVWRLWSESRALLLEEVLQEAGYMPCRTPRVRVLVALRADQGAKLCADGAEMVEPLALACSDANEEIATRARTALSALTNPDAREAVCRLFIEHGVPAAQEAALAGGYVPRDEVARAVFFLLTGQWERYDDLDFDRHLLRTAFSAAKPDLRQRLLAQLRSSGRADLLSSAVGLGEARGTAGALPEAELRSVIGMLEKHQEWGKLWGLVFEVPLVWSARLVRLLGATHWQPEREDAREVFAQLRELLTQGLPERPDSIASLIPAAVCLAHARVKGNVNAVAFAPARPVIAIGTGHRKLALWNFQHSKLEWTHGGFDHSIGRVTFSHDGLLLCGERTNGSDSCRLHVRRGEEMRRLGEHQGSVTGLEAVDGTLVLSTGRDNRVALWDVAGERCVASREFDFWPRGLKLSPDRKRAALSHSGVAVLDLPSLEMFQDGDDAFVGMARTVCFSPDGGSIIAGKVSGKVLALPLDGNARRRARPVAVEHTAEITGLAALTGRSALLTGDASGLVNFSTWPQQARVGRVMVEGRRLTSLHVSEDEAFMVTGDSDERIGFWDIRGLELPVLLSRPLVQATPTHLGVAASFRQAKELPVEARNALAFLEILLRFRFRYDIEIDEIAGIQAGEFDIEIQG